MQPENPSGWVQVTRHCAGSVGAVGSQATACRAVCARRLCAVHAVARVTARLGWHSNLQGQRTTLCDTKPFKLHTVIPGRQLYYWRRFQGLETARILLTLEHYGIRSVINLWHTPDRTTQLSVPYYVMAPMQDSEVVLKLGAPVTEQWERLSALGAGYIRLGYPLLIQCYGGRNRSAFLAALVCQRLTNCTGLQALQAVRANDPGAIKNPSFELFLLGNRKIGSVGISRRQQVEPPCA